MEKINRVMEVLKYPIIVFFAVGFLFLVNRRGNDFIEQRGSSPILIHINPEELSANEGKYVQLSNHCLGQGSYYVEHSSDEDEFIPARDCNSDTDSTYLMIQISDEGYGSLEDTWASIDNGDIDISKGQLKSGNSMNSTLQKFSRRSGEVFHEDRIWTLVTSETPEQSYLEWQIIRIMVPLVALAILGLFMATDIKKRNKRRTNTNSV